MPVMGAVPAHATDAPAEPVPPRVVADELNNPRQLSWSADGRILVVAEAGSGAKTPEDCTGEGEEQICLGPTGSVTEVFRPHRAEPFVERVVEGLPSVAGPDGSFAVGTNGADDLPGEDGVYVVAQSPGLADEPTMEDSAQGAYVVANGEDAPPEGEHEGELPEFVELVGGDIAFLAKDLSRAETELNPDGAQLESNPYAVLFVDQDRDDDEDGFALVADAGANTVWKIAPQTDESKVVEDDPTSWLTVSVFAAYPVEQRDEGDERQPEFVPTSLAQDSEGNIFVGGLGSEVAGAAEVVQYDASGEELQRFGGFTGITGLAVDEEHLYVSQIFGATPPAPPGPGGPEDEAPAAPTTAPGSVVKASRSDSADPARYEVDVPFPGGLAVDSRGNVYVSAYSTSPATGVQDAFGSGSLDLEGGQVWDIDFTGARVSPPVTPPTDGGPVGTDGAFVPVGEDYYAIEFTSDACGQDVTVTAGDVRAVEERVTVFPGDLVKRELRGRATVDITRADGVVLDEVDVSGEALFIESKPTDDGVVKVVASLEGSSIVVPFDDAGAAELVANDLPPIVLWLGGNITFSDTLQLGDSPDSMPTTIETDIVNNTAVGVLDVCALLDAESGTSPTASPRTGTPAPSV